MATINNSPDSKVKKLIEKEFVTMVNLKDPVSRKLPYKVSQNLVYYFWLPQHAYSWKIN